MFRLVYTSVQTPGFDSKALEQLCEQAAKNNRAQGIEGLLLCNDLEFLQCLEGPRDAVANLYSKIVKDPRHTDIRLLVSENIASRLFRDWSMVGLAINPRSLLSAEPTAYTLLDHRLYRPWKSLGLGSCDLIYEYAKVKAELEKAGSDHCCGTVIDVYQP